MKAYSPAFTVNHTLLTIPYLTGIYMYDYTFTSILRTISLNHTHFQANYNFNAKFVDEVWSTFLCIDVTLLQQNRTLFVDHFSFSSIGTLVSSNWVSTHYNYKTGMAYV